MFKKSIFFSLMIIVVLFTSGCGDKKESEKPSNSKICSNLVKTIKPYVESKDTDGFNEKWDNREGFNTTDNCSTIECLCPEAWDLFMLNKINTADKYLAEGFVSSAYNSLGSTYIQNNSKIKEYFNSNKIFKILSTKEKEEITGIYYSFGSWEWKHEPGSKFKFKTRYVNYGSSNMSLQFSNYSDEVLISGHLKPSKHSNWNPDKNISVNWYNYKIVENKIYIKLENESSYDVIFEILDVTDTTLSLKLLIDLDDVKAGQVYNYTYQRT